MVEDFQEIKPGLLRLVQLYKEDLSIHRSGNCDSIRVKDNKIMFERLHGCRIPQERLLEYAKIMSEFGVSGLSFKGELKSTGTLTGPVMLCVQSCMFSVYYVYAEGVAIPCRKRFYAVDGEIPRYCGEIEPGWQYIVYDMSW